ncbi:DUF2796 domain-containing protein [Thalassospiraceae bacterium LMO-SO8]|nr:DUF2796 domain-containing protein [Alphaproteobacteria bacterium LMO-S08]WND76243.1 DUF2796 domain-containing protein [Thalassospiraceae bacterium LMO-SO8]
MKPMSLLPVPRIVSFKPRFAAAALLAGLFVAAKPASAAEREHGPHEHGVGQLSLAVEGNEVEIEITAPGADIVGFEHAAETEADRAALAAAAARLKDAVALFHFPPRAACRLEEAEVHSALLDGAHGHEKGHDQKTEAHAEFRAHYHFRCADPAALSHVDLGYFTAFPAARELEARTITAKGQGAAELTADRPRLTF